MTLMNEHYKVIKEYDGINSLLEDHPEFNRSSIYKVITGNKIYRRKYRIKYTDCYDSGTDKKVIRFKG